MPEGKDPAGDGIVLGFDFGLRRIGVALGNGVTRSASGLKVVHRVGTHGEPSALRAHCAPVSELIRDPGAEGEADR